MFRCSGNPTTVWQILILFRGPCLKFQPYRPPGLVAQCLSMAFMLENMGRFHSSNSNDSFWLEKYPYPKYLPTCSLPVMVQTNYWLAGLFFCEKGKIVVEKSDLSMRGTFLLKKWNRGSICTSLFSEPRPMWWSWWMVEKERLRFVLYLCNSSSCKKAKQASLVFMIHVQYC